VRVYIFLALIQTTKYALNTSQNKINAECLRIVGVPAFWQNCTVDVCCVCITIVTFKTKIISFERNSVAPSVLARQAVT
jgi:hypothetical protein